LDQYDIRKITKAIELAKHHAASLPADDTYEALAALVEAVGLIRDGMDELPADVRSLRRNGAMANLESLQAWKAKSWFRSFKIEVRLDAICDVSLHGRHEEEAFACDADCETAIGIALASAELCDAPLAATCRNCGRRYTPEMAAKRQNSIEADFITFCCECGKRMTIDLPPPESMAAP
jgi:hypothetical protein